MQLKPKAPAGALTFLAPPDDLLIFQRISQNRGNKLTQIITNRWTVYGHFQPAD